jgi:hypothetical protein
LRKNSAVIPQGLKPSLIAGGYRSAEKRCATQIPLVDFIYFIDDSSDTVHNPAGYDGGHNDARELPAIEGTIV